MVTEKNNCLNFANQNPKIYFLANLELEDLELGIFTRPCSKSGNTKSGAMSILLLNQTILIIPGLVAFHAHLKFHDRNLWEY